MSKEMEQKIMVFFEKVLIQYHKGMTYRDAMFTVAASLDKEIAAWLSQADVKYQEATYDKTKLSQQSNVDECALASMGKLWDSENFEGSNAQIASSQEETILDTFYFILKYAQSENPLEASLKANDSVCGDKVTRKVYLEMLFQ